VPSSLYRWCQRVQKIQISITCQFDSSCRSQKKSKWKYSCAQGPGTCTTLHLSFQSPRSVRGTVARGDASDIKRIRPLALTGATAGLLLFVLTLLFGLALRFPPLRVGGITTVVGAAAAAARVFSGGAVRVRGGGRGARVLIRAVAEAGEVALGLADPWAGASLVAFEEDDLDAALGEERGVPEVDQLGGHL